MDFIDGTSAATMQCIKGAGYFIAPRVFKDGGGGQCDLTGSATIKLATGLGGMGIMPYVRPTAVCIARNPHATTCVTQSPFPSADLPKPAHH